MDLQGIYFLGVWYKEDSMIEKLKERLKVLESQRMAAQLIMQKATADLNAIDGAIQEVKHWINEMEVANGNQSKTQGDN